jgi:hypothetical protein
VGGYRNDAQRWREDRAEQHRKQAQEWHRQRGEHHLTHPRQGLYGHHE